MASGSRIKNFLGYPNSNDYYDLEGGHVCFPFTE